MSFRIKEQRISEEQINDYIEQRAREERMRLQARRDREAAEVLETLRLRCAVEIAKAKYPDLLDRTPPPHGYVSLDKLRK